MTRNLLVAVIAAAAIVAMQAPASAVIISAVNNNSNDAGDVYVVVPNGLVEDVEAFIDRTHEYNNIPAYLVGTDFVQTANDDKTAGAGFNVELTTGPESADIYLFLDDRINVAANMPWVALAGFVDTGDDIDIDEGGNGSIDNTSAVYVLSNVAPMTTVLLEQDDGGSRNMYGIAAVALPPVVPEPVTATLGLFGLAGLGMVTRRRRA